MSATECTQEKTLDNSHEQGSSTDAARCAANGRLEAENVRLRDNRPDIAAGLDAEAAVERLTKRNEQLESENAELNSTIETVEARLRELMDAAEDQTKRIEELSEDLAKSRCEHEDVAEENARLTKAVREISESKELEILRAVNEERRRFDDREERLLRQIDELDHRMPVDAWTTTRKGRQTP